MLNKEVNKATYIASQIAEEHRHQNYGAAHMVKALLNRDLSLLRHLHGLDIDVYYVEEWAEVRMEDYSKRAMHVSSSTPDEAVQCILDEAEGIKTKLKKEEVDLICLFIAAITPGVGFNYDQLKALPVNHAQLLGRLSGISNDKNVTKPTITNHAEAFSEKNDVLKKYTIDILNLAKNGVFAAIVNRDKELKKITEILSRKSKPNVIVIGEAGVGKTTLVQNLAREIEQLKIVETLQKVQLLEVDVANLLSGASYKGEVEDRLQSIFNEAKQLEKPVLFIDNIHSLLQDSAISQGILNVLKAELNKGEVTLIGTTSADNHRKYIVTDEAFARRFETVLLEEPSKQQALEILKSIGHTFSEHHNLQLSESTLQEAIRLSKRYLKDKSLPDSALDLLDRTMSAANVSKQSLPSDLEELKNSIEHIQDKDSEEVKNKLLDTVYLTLKNKLSPIVQGKYDTEDAFGFSSYNKKRGYIDSLLKNIEEHSKQELTAINEEDLAAMVSNITGIPAGKVQKQEQERLLEMEATLKKRVIGQDNAVKTVAEAIIESRSGLSKAGQPIGSFFFSGPTGTGKTELAKSLAEFLFNDESAIVRFDMSEFKEEHSAALLYGAPPGYVGYEEGGMLVNKIREKPYAIVLFDEIEKAHQSVFDVFLQILDEGKLSDRLGKIGDFSNAVILFTSNIGSEFISESITAGKIPSSEKLLEIMSTYFRPEFLGRITEIVPFAPISEKNVPFIFDLHLKKELLSLTERLGITVEIDEKTRKYLSLDGFSPTYGVRPLKAVIRNKLKRPLSKMLISGTLKAPQTVKVQLKEKELVFNVVKP
ncbi:AAA family ATPase [Costertonia aggregata]|uniref:ATP-dependent Clp protease ATP-binding subunit n=1 Tax=Costertonia aggregata TaxID=343403 RepID=A0A7H9ATU7_9FLAO|nr:ATP-dependent Clp protease ATP-binding subunit [Costertonia aggregata]QLG46846.1 ATP-dependent Clp protease ATP-binding subunit [Costertonia aggregata]